MCIDIWKLHFYLQVAYAFQSGYIFNAFRIFSFWSCRRKIQDLIWFPIFGLPASLCIAVLYWRERLMLSQKIMKFSVKLLPFDKSFIKLRKTNCSRLCRNRLNYWELGECKVACHELLLSEVITDSYGGNDNTNITIL